MAATTDSVDTADLERLFQQWRAVAELQLKFLESLGQFKLDVAKSELVAAVTAGEWAVARMKARVAQELAAAMKRLSRLRHQTARRSEQLGRHARAVARIRSGEDLSPGQLTLMWGGFTVFERMAPITVLEGIIKMPLDEQARRGTSYFNVVDPRSPCPNPPDSVDNVHALIAWLRRNRYVPRRGTQAYRQVVGAMTAIGEVAQREVAQLEAALRALETGTYDTWQPVVIGALPDSVDARKIIKAGVK